MIASFAASVCYDIRETHFRWLISLFNFNYSASSFANSHSWRDFTSSIRVYFAIVLMHFVWHTIVIIRVGRRKLLLIFISFLCAQWTVCRRTVSALLVDAPHILIHIFLLFYVLGFVSPSGSFHIFQFTFQWTSIDFKWLSNEVKITFKWRNHTWSNQLITLLWKIRIQTSTMLFRTLEKLF